MNFEDINKYIFQCCKNLCQNEMLPDYDEVSRLYKKFITDKHKVPNGYADIIEENLYEAFEMCEYRINHTDYHDCELVAIAHSTTTQIIKQFKFHTDDLMFLTIRPSDEMRLEDFQKLVNKLLSKEIITSCIGVWEQKGTSYSTLGQGKHVHIILKFNFNQAMKSHRQQIKDFLKKQGVIFDIGKVPLRKLYIIDKLYYMGLLQEDDEIVYNPNLKYKKTKEKMKCLEYDRIFQKQNNLEIIEKDIHIILNSTKSTVESLTDSD